jgi:hypothetical protein
LPLSSIPTVRVTVVVALLAVVKRRLLPEMKVFTFDNEPERLIEAVPLPVTVTPPPLVAERVPLPTPRVIATALLPASTSAKLIPVTGEATSSVTESEPGTVMVGASFTPDTERFTLVELDCAPPPPVLPLSFMPTVRVTVEVALLAVVKRMLLAEIKEFTFDREPERLRDPVPLPVTVTPPPLVAERVPLPTPRVTPTALLPASTSEKLIPVNADAVSSVTEMEPGAVIEGASFTFATLRGTVVEAVSGPPAPELPMSLMSTPIA